MMRWIVTLVLAALLVPSLAAEPAIAGSHGKDTKCGKSRAKTDKEITNFIYDVTIPWPFRKHAEEPGDADGDGVVDGVDMCPGTPKGATVDARGCPADEDGDGVYDGIDKCPGTPKGATVNAKGCPMDSDGDGIYDGIDMCPDTPKGTDVNSKGCPISKVEKAMLDTGIFATTEIVFDTDKAVIKPGSHKILGEIGGVLAAHPELKVEIGGHTDSTGSEAYNLKLSEKRAQAVFDHLAKNIEGVRAEQLFPKGFGESRPIASNDTAEGRAQNRRVEFRVLEK